MNQNTSLVDKITTELQGRISQGNLKAGEKLPSERNLSVDFGVGRTTIREALKSLVVRGLVIRKGRGVIVTEPENISPPATDLADLAVQVSIRQLYEVRKLIEVQMAGWAAQRATTDDVEVIRRSIEPANPNRSFHDALAQAVHNPALMQIYECGRHLFFRLPFFWKLFDDAEVKALRTRRHELARRWHEYILDAIAQHDGAEAQGAMFQHLDVMEKDLLRRLRQKDSAPARNEFYSHPMLGEFALDGPSAEPRGQR
jgi:GntR family transcriptional regulator, transcriptional repressor for pyruvate dehydrogenase complex